MYNVYILLNRAKTRTYTGVTADVDRRLKEHNQGKVSSSRPYCPYDLIHIETYNTLKEARRKERFYKSTTGRRRLHEIISSCATNGRPFRFAANYKATGGRKFIIENFAKPV